MAKKQPGYAEALAELEEILEQLEGDDLDVDQLAALVGRASELLITCRSSITARSRRCRPHRQRTRRT